MVLKKVLKKMKQAGIFLLLLFVAVLLSAQFGGENIYTQATAVAAKKDAAKDGEKKIKYWVAPMDPTYIREGPGKSPMGMDLVPVYEDDEPSAEGVIRIDPVTVQNIGVRTTKATRGPLYSTIRTVGHVTYNEELVEHVHTKISGWVETLFVDTTGESVYKGQKLLTIYSPELVATQEEYLQALEYKQETAGSRFEDITRGADTLIESTRRRLLLMDIDPGQIKALEERGDVQKNMLLRAPATGIVIHKKVFEGMRISPGMEIYTIADLSKVWVLVSVYEYELPFIRVGQMADMTLPYEPGAKYRGRITFIYPYLEPKTRTIQVRMEFDNPGLRFKPDMYANITIDAKASDDAILVPSEAVIRTGARNVVITALGGGKFLPKDVTIGPEGKGFVQVLEGLDEGETVVTSGQFLIDSESNLRETINKMLEAKKAARAQKDEPASAADANGNNGGMQMVMVDITDEQRRLMSELIDAYIKMHAAFVSESTSDVVSEVDVIDQIVKKIKASDTAGRLIDVSGPIEGTLADLASGDLEKARTAFAVFSKTMVAYVKGTGRKDALSSEIKVYICPMKKDLWLQTGAEIQNPYLGKDMLICGTEETY